MPNLGCRTALVLMMAVAGGILGLCTGGLVLFQGRSVAEREYPYPHQIPKYPGGISLRLAMVHDVIHERFPRHGTAYYTERNRIVRDQLAKTGEKEAATDAFLALVDDLGVGLDALGQDDEAVRLLRDKLRRQLAAGRTGRELYTTYANLGTFLIHGNFAALHRGDPTARDRLKEGLDFIRKAIEVNPSAHFGREEWQANVVAFLLAAHGRLELLYHFDLVGDSLQKPLAPQDGRCAQPEWFHGQHYSARAALTRGELDRRQVRSPDEPITRVGAEDNWAALVMGAHEAPVPFDEPTLGIIGMWRLGGGANPHFALALGEIMLRVGQRYIAWTAYERAILLEERFWPDRAVRQRFVDHCRARQRLIEDTLPSQERAALRPRFEAELDFGRRYQQAYQDFEARQIAAGVSLDDPHFYDAFHAEHGPIASPLGRADWALVEDDFWHNWQPSPAGSFFSAGLFALMTAALLRWLDWDRRHSTLRCE